MISGLRQPVVLPVVCAAVLAACGAATQETEPRTVQPGAPGEPGRVLSDEERSVTAGLPHTEADVRFMQNMILHHRQALTMSSLASERASAAQVRLLARRIHRAQEEEIALMSLWLEKREEEVPGADARHGAHDPPREGPTLMAGILTREQMKELEAAEGEEFDRLFLERMIFHHRGALEMVSALFSAPGAAQDGEIFRFASHVDVDQSVEIARMERMLREYQ